MGYIGKRGGLGFGNKHSFRNSLTTFNYKVILYSYHPEVLLMLPTRNREVARKERRK
jgi:hypothetical protein